MNLSIHLIQKWRESIFNGIFLSVFSYSFLFSIQCWLVSGLLLYDHIMAEGCPVFWVPLVNGAVRGLPGHQWHHMKAIYLACDPIWNIWLYINMHICVYLFAGILTPINKPRR